MDYFDELMKILRRWDHLGSRITARGVRLICKTPHRGSMAYLHRVYEPLNEDQICLLEMKIGRRLPPALRTFYQKANGLSIFAGELAIQGLRHDYSRELTDEGAYQPGSLEYGNTLERIRGWSSDIVLFGWYPMDPGFNVYIHDGEDKVIMCPRRNIEPTLYEWPDFPTFLLTEADRLAKLFNEEGRLIDENMPTVPLEAIRRQEKIH